MGVTRRRFLTGHRHKPAPFPRPPWALPEERFLDLCTGCGDCISACPTQILHRDGAQRPFIDFTLGGCTLCGKCLLACHPGALSRQANEGRAFPWRVRISDDCLPRHGVECRICGDACESGAIHFHLRAGAPAMPLLDNDCCTGCGACFAPCPSAAIRPLRPQEAA